MNKFHCAAALRKVAKRHGISVAEVRAEISKSIFHAMQSEDLKEKKFWETHFSNGQPTPEEFMMVLLKNVDFSINQE